MFLKSHTFQYMAAPSYQSLVCLVWYLYYSQSESDVIYFSGLRWSLSVSVLVHVCVIRMQPTETGAGFVVK